MPVYEEENPTNQREALNKRHNNFNSVFHFDVSASPNVIKKV